MGANQGKMSTFNLTPYPRLNFNHYFSPQKSDSTQDRPIFAGRPRLSASANQQAGNRRATRGAGRIRPAG